MLVKGSEDYKKAQEVANEIVKIASYNRWHEHSLYNLYCNDFYSFIRSIMDLDIFASKIAKTIYDGFKLNYTTIARVSSKQAWILACASVENNIQL